MNRTAPLTWLRFSPCLLLLALCQASGCAAPGFFFGPDADPKAAESLATLTYPKDAPLGENLDIIAYKDWNQLVLTNRTARAFSQVQVWINQQYVSTVASIPVGQQTTLNLNEFINQHGEAFPVGGLLNPERSYRVVLVEIFEPGTGGRRYRVVVRTDEKLPGQ